MKHIFKHVKTALVKPHSHLDNKNDRRNCLLRTFMCGTPRKGRDRLIKLASQLTSMLASWAPSSYLTLAQPAKQLENSLLFVIRSLPCKLLIVFSLASLAISISCQMFNTDIMNAEERKMRKLQY